MDKRSDQILVKLDPSDNTLEHIEYGDLIYYSCEAKCRHNYEMYKSTKICVKDPVEFENELIALNIPMDEVSSTDSKPFMPKQEKPSDNKLIIIWIIFGCLAVIIVIVLIVLKMKNFF